MTIFFCPVIVMILAVQFGSHEWFIRRLTTKTSVWHMLRRIYSPKVPNLRSIHHGIVVDPKQIRTSNSASLISSLSDLCNLLPNHFSDVFNHHVALRDSFECIQSRSRIGL